MSAVVGWRLVFVGWAAGSQAGCPQTTAAMSGTAMLVLVASCAAGGGKQEMAAVALSPTALGVLGGCLLPPVHQLNPGL